MAVTLVAVAAATFGRGFIYPIANIFLLGALNVLLTRRTERLLALVWVAIWFAIPLFLIHGTINRQFPVDVQVTIPLRSQGIVFATQITLQITTLLIPVLFWRSTVAKEVMQLAAVLRLPRVLTAVIFQAASLVREVERRGAAILLAQRARGLRTSGGPLTRVRALLPVVLPLVVGLLRDAPERGRIQEYLGSIEATEYLTGPRSVAPFELSAVLAVSSLAVALAAAWS